jgi:hypothetical protein
LLEQVTAVVGHLLLVDDGMGWPAAAELDRRARAAGADVLHLASRSGKGHALVAGLRRLRAGPRPYAAVLMIDADGQHPVAAIPAFLAAAEHAELVIGNRFAAFPAAMPRTRRAANRIASVLLSATTAMPVPDSQCGMRLLHGRALAEVGFPGGGMEAETRHLKRCLLAGVPVAWVPIPALYDGEPSAFRPARDSIAVLTAAVAGPNPGATLRRRSTAVAGEAA